MAVPAVPGGPSPCPARDLLCLQSVPLGLGALYFGAQVDAHTGNAVVIMVAILRESDPLPNSRVVGASRAGNQRGVYSPRDPSLSDAASKHASRAFVSQPELPRRGVSGVG